MVARGDGRHRQPVRPVGGPADPPHRRSGRPEHLGEADLSSREALSKVLESAGGGRRELVVDLSGLRFADTAAARAIVRAAAGGGNVRLVGASVSLTKLLVFNGAAEVPGLLPAEVF